MAKKTKTQAKDQRSLAGISATINVLRSPMQRIPQTLAYISSLSSRQLRGQMLTSASGAAQHTRQHG